MIKTRHSFYEARSRNESEASKSESFSRSDINIIRSKDFPSVIDSGCVNRHGLSIEAESSEEYCRNYELKVPVKDSSKNLTSEDAATYDKKELTNSDLDKLETRVYNNISKELQTDESSTETDECNLKIFKSTIQVILDNFYTNMNDCELYKKKFHDILSKNNNNIVDEMADLINVMIQHIISSTSCISSSNNRANVSSEFSEIRTEVTHKIESSTLSRATGDHNLEATVDEYKNENYFTDSSFDKESSKMNRSNDKKSNIYMLSPCIEIKMDDRNILSEIYIRDRFDEETYKVASAENIKRVAAKKLQVKKYMKRETKCESSDNIIPIKISYAKKNIHSELDENNQSFIYKICNYLCRKLRKTTFG